MVASSVCHLTHSRRRGTTSFMRRPANSHMIASALHFATGSAVSPLASGKIVRREVQSRTVSHIDCL
jgi:hypothetical protein